MAMPTQPTATTICTEALTRKLNGGSPGATVITRAINYGLEKVKRDLMEICQTWRPLMQTDYQVLRAGVSKYADPSDCEKLHALTLMTGDHTGSLTGANESLTQVTLAADEDISESEAVGSYLFLSSGTGINQAVQIDDYDTTTKVATLNEWFPTTDPDGDEGYIICNTFYPLTYEPAKRREGVSYSLPGRPTHWFPFDDASTNYVELYPVPDEATYVLKRIYFADLRRVDLSSNLYTKLLRRWAGILEQGVYVWTLGEDDNRYEREFQVYSSMLKDYRARDGYMMDVSELVRRVEE